MYRDLFNDKEKSIVAYIKNNIDIRYTHIFETRELSIELAKHYNEDIEKSSLAALLHDISKYLNADDMRKIIFEYDSTIYPKHYSSALLHAKASVVIASREFLVDDVAVLNAIEQHTVGSANMTMLDKILYVADYLEPSRNIEIADKLRAKVFEDFDYVFREVVINSIEYVISTKRFLDYNSIDLYNSVILK